MIRLSSRDLPIASTAATNGASLDSVIWNLPSFELEDPAFAVLHETWPEDRYIPFLAALREYAPSRASDLEAALRFLNGLVRVPVIAVAGLINSGKSSLVASFLSEAGRRRVLRGVARSAGTHRFTLWCPEPWGKDPAFRASLESLLSGVFGTEAAQLAEEPEAAHEQQRDRDRIGVPLLAFDSGLDHHGVCLLDCPDIQRHETGDSGPTRRRRALLQAAGHVCSAVFIVLPRSELEVEQVAEVLDALPGASRVLAINFCSGEPPEIIAAEARSAWEGIAREIHVAYDFRHRGYEDYTPRWDPNRALLSAAGAGASSPAWNDAFPCFFSAAPDPAANRPEAVDPNRSLLQFPRRLTPEALLQSRQRQLLQAVRQQILEGGDHIAATAEARNREVRRAAASLQFELERLLEREGQARIRIDPRFIEDFATGIRRTAPMDLKPFLWMSQKASVAMRSIRAAAKGLSGGIAEAVREEGHRLGAALADARITAEDVAERLRLWSASCRHHHDREYWHAVAEAILRRFNEQEHIRLPQAEWDERARDLWRAVPVWRARLTVATTVLVALAAMAVLSVAGGPVIMALGAKSAVLSVTAKELLVVIGLGSIAQGEAARRLDEWLLQRIGHLQKAVLLAAAFDEVGLPRSLLHDAPPPPGMAGRPNANGFAVRELHGRIRTWLPNNWKRLREALDRLDR